MSEIIALARLSISRSRTLITIAIIYFVVIHLMMAVYGSSGLGQPNKLQESVTVVTGFLSLPLFAVALALFDFSDKADMSSRATGYLPWLLRSPLPNWKLVLVPLTMKTTWVFAICGAFALTSRTFGIPLERWLLPSIGITTLMVTACLVTWRPFRWTYSRLCVCGLLLVPAYAWLTGSIFLAFVDRPDVSTVNLNLSVAWFVGTVALAGTSLMAFRSLRLARCHVAGVISESRGWLGERESKRTALVVFDEPQTVSPVGALIRYDASALWSVGSKIVVFAWLALVLYWCFVDNADFSAFVFMAIVLVYPAVFLCELTLSSRDGGFLPNLLAMSPIRSTSIVWTRQAAVSVVWFLSLLGVPIVITCWHLRGAGKRFFSGWNETMMFHYGVPDAAWRMAAAITLVALILIVRQTTWSVAAASTGQRRYGLYVFAAKFAIGFALLSWFLFYFLRFPNWETWNEWAWQRTAKLPMLLPWLLVTKIAIVAIATWKLYRSQLARPQTVIAIAVGFVITTLVVAVVLWRLIPSDSVFLWHCIAMTAVLMPYSRIALAPLCLAHNRHR